MEEQTDKVVQNLADMAKLSQEAQQGLDGLKVPAALISSLEGVDNNLKEINKQLKSLKVPTELGKTLDGLNASAHAANKAMTSLSSSMQGVEKETLSAKAVFGDLHQVFVDAGKAGGDLLNKLQDQESSLALVNEELAAEEAYYSAIDKQLQALYASQSNLDGEIQKSKESYKELGSTQSQAISGIKESTQELADVSQKSADVAISANQAAAAAKIIVDKQAADMSMEAAFSAAAAKMQVDQQAADMSITVSKNAAAAKIALEREAVDAKIAADKAAVDAKIAANQEATDATIAASQEAAAASEEADKAAAAAAQEAANIKIQANKAAAEQSIEANHRAAHQTIDADKAAAAASIDMNAQATLAKIEANKTAAHAMIDASQEAADASIEANRNAAHAAIDASKEAADAAKADNEELKNSSLETNQERLEDAQTKSDELVQLSQETSQERTLIELEAQKQQQEENIADLELIKLQSGEKIAALKADQEVLSQVYEDENAKRAAASVRMFQSAIAGSQEWAKKHNESVQKMGEATKNGMNLMNKIVQDATSLHIKLANQEYEEKSALLQQQTQEHQEAAAIAMADLEAQYAQEQAMLQAKLDQGLISQSQYDAQVQASNEQRTLDIAQNEQDLQSKREDIAGEEERLRKERVDAENKAAQVAFESNKAFSLAEVIVDTAMGVTKALATGGPVFGPIGAAAVTASGATSGLTISQEKFQPKTYASGTAYHLGGLAMVGEAGPELVNLPKGSSVTTAGKTKNKLKEDKPTVNNFNIEGDIVNAKESGKRTGIEIESQVKLYKGDIESFSEDMLHSLQSIEEQSSLTADLMAHDIGQIAQHSQVMAQQYDQAVESMENFSSAGLENFGLVWDALDQMNAETAKFNDYVSQMTAAIGNAGRAMTDAIGGAFDNVDKRKEQLKESEKQLEDLKKKAEELNKELEGTTGEDRTAIEQQLKNVNNEIANTQKTIGVLSNQIKLTGNDIAQMAMQIASALSTMGNDITQAIVGGQRQALEKEYQQQLKQLDALQAAHDEHWDEIEARHKAAVQAMQAENGEAYSQMHEQLAEKFYNGLMSEKEYMEELALLKQEEAEAKAQEEAEARAMEQEAERLAAQKAAEQEAIEEQKRQIEEDNLRKQDALERKAFNADKANSLVQIATSAATAILGLWAGYASMGPVGVALAGVQTGIVGAMALTQAGVVGAQQYTPKYASGTAYHEGGMAMVGEAGPELVHLPKGSAVSTAGQTRNMIGGGRGGVTINIHGHVYGIEDLQQVIGDAIAQAEQKMLHNVSFTLDSGYEA